MSIGDDNYDADDDNGDDDGNVGDEADDDDDDGSSASLSAADPVILLGKKAHNKHTKITLLQDVLNLKCHFFYGLTFLPLQIGFLESNTPNFWASKDLFEEPKLYTTGQEPPQKRLVILTIESLQLVR